MLSSQFGCGLRRRVPDLSSCSHSQWRRKRRTANDDTTLAKDRHHNSVFVAAAATPLPASLLVSIPHYAVMDASSLFLIQYLRSEAEMSEEKARRLRAQAAQLAEEFGSDLPGHYELGVAELPPLDENGVPKYKGRKRGRKKKQRKRVHDPNKPKRAHTGYTFYIQGACQECL
jgi:hypothetical protein